MNIFYRFANETDSDNIQMLIKEIFDEFVGWQYIEEGQKEFYKYIDS